MVKSLWNSLLASPPVFAAMLVVAAAAMLTAQTQSNAASVPATLDPKPHKFEQPMVANTLIPLQQLVADKPATPAASSPAQDSPNVIDQVVRYSKEGTNTKDDAIGQVTSVSQLRDVQPTDWAFQALQSLVERYGVIAGYPDGSFRGNRALTRYEFAAGLNAALNRVNELIGSGSTSLVRHEDVTTLQRLQQEFSTELATVRGRVDALEARTAELEANQFSTTTKLVGEGVFTILDNLGNYRNDNTVFQNRVRLDFQTSFTGQDTLHTRITAGNAQRLGFHNAVVPGGRNGPFATYDGEGSSTLTEEPNTNNAFGLDWLSYYFNVAPNSQLYVAATGGMISDIVPPGNPYFNDGDGGTAALTLFGQENPIYRIGGGAGAGFNLALGKSGILGATSLSGIYLADNASNPGRSTGLFKGDYVAVGQLNFSLNDRFAIAATYAHGYHTTGSGIFNNGGPGSNNSPFQGSVGTAQANDPSILLAGGQRPTVTNSYGGEIAYRLSEKISISGFVDETNARILGRGDANIWSYGLGVALPDFGKKGNVLGVLAGVEPTLRGLRANGVPRNFGRRDETYHFEGFYKYQLTDNISITPGIILLTAPGQNIRNNDAWIGTLRTTFTF